MNIRDRGTSIVRNQGQVSLHASRAAQGALGFIAAFLLLAMAAIAHGATKLDIVSTKINGTTVNNNSSATIILSPGQSFTFYIGAENNGDDSPAGYNNITASFPSFTASMYKANVTDTDKSPDLVYSEYFDREATGGDANANYVMVEAVDSNGWDGSDVLTSESNDLTLSITPSANDFTNGYFDIYYRTAASNTAQWLSECSSCWTYNPVSSSYTDCLAFKAYRIRVMLQTPPNKVPASGIFPSNGATGQTVSTDLSWPAATDPNGDTVQYKVYFGTDSSPDSGEYKTTSTTRTYDPGTLAYKTTYYWRIDTFDGTNTTTGDVWSFSTRPSTPQATINSPAQSASLLVGASQTFRVDATDADGGLDKVEWYLDGVLKDTTGTVPLNFEGATGYETKSFDFPSAGSFAVKAIVYDDDGLTASVTWNVGVHYPSGQIETSVKYPGTQGAITPDELWLFNSGWTTRLATVTPASSVYRFPSSYEYGTYHVQAMQDGIYQGHVDVALDQALEQVSITTSRKSDVQFKVYYSDSATPLVNATVRVKNQDNTTIRQGMTDATGTAYFGASDHASLWDSTTGANANTYFYQIEIVHNNQNVRTVTPYEVPGGMGITEAITTTASMPFTVTSVAVSVSPEDPATVRKNGTITGSGSIIGTGSGTVEYQWIVLRPDASAWSSPTLTTSMSNGSASVAAFVDFPTVALGRHKTWIRIMSPNGPDNSKSNERYYTVVQAACTGDAEHPLPEVMVGFDNNPASLISGQQYWLSATIRDNGEASTGPLGITFKLENAKLVAVKSAAGAEVTTGSGASLGLGNNTYLYAFSDLDFYPGGSVPGHVLSDFRGATLFEVLKDNGLASGATTTFFFKIEITGPGGSIVKVRHNGYIIDSDTQIADRDGLACTNYVTHTPGGTNSNDQLISSFFASAALYSELSKPVSAFVKWKTIVMPDGTDYGLYASLQSGRFFNTFLDADPEAGIQAFYLTDDPDNASDIVPKEEYIARGLHQLLYPLFNRLPALGFSYFGEKVTAAGATSFVPDTSVGVVLGNAWRLGWLYDGGDRRVAYVDAIRHSLALLDWPNDTHFDFVKSGQKIYRVEKLDQRTKNDIELMVTEALETVFDGNRTIWQVVNETPINRENMTLADKLKLIRLFVQNKGVNVILQTLQKTASSPLALANLEKRYNKACDWMDSMSFGLNFADKVALDVLLTQYLSASTAAEERLALLEDAYAYVKANKITDMDPELLAAMNQVRNEITSQIGLLETVFDSVMRAVNWDTISSVINQLNTPETLHAGIGLVNRITTKLAVTLHFNANMGAIQLSEASLQTVTAAISSVVAVAGEYREMADRRHTMAAYMTLNNLLQDFYYDWLTNGSAGTGTAVNLQQYQDLSQLLTLQNYMIMNLSNDMLVAWRVAPEDWFKNTCDIAFAAMQAPRNFGLGLVGPVFSALVDFGTLSGSWLWDNDLGEIKDVVDMIKKANETAALREQYLLDSDGTSLKGFLVDAYLGNYAAVPPPVLPAPSLSIMPLPEVEAYVGESTTVAVALKGLQAGETFSATHDDSRGMVAITGRNLTITPSGLVPVGDYQVAVNVTTSLARTCSTTLKIRVLARTDLRLEVSAGSLVLAEGDTATVQVRLNAQPPAPVTVTAGRQIGDRDIAIQSGATLTFSTTNWYQYQNIAFTAAEDADTLNGAATFRLSVPGIPMQDIMVTERDNDTLTFVADTTLTLTTTGNANWFGQGATFHSGASAAQSGAITHGQSTRLEATMPPLDAPKTLSFFWKVSSEGGYDFLRFSIDGVEQAGRISGEVGWQQQSFVISSGAHKLTWEYAKDASSSSGADAGWVDEVALSAAAQYALTVTKAGTGSGNVAVTPGALAWNANTGTASYVSGASVLLSAAENAGSAFTGWSGDASSCRAAKTCTLAMGAARNVTATFTESDAPVISNATSTTADGSYQAGTAINITLNFSETVTSPGLAITLNSGKAITTGALNGTTWSGTYTVEAGDTAADLGISTITGTITDAAGNAAANPTIPAGQNISDARDIVVDTTPPAAPVPSATTPTTSSKPTWNWASGGNGGNGIYRYRLDNPDLSTGATETAALSYTPATALPVGAYTLYLQERDAAGNWSAAGSTTVTIMTGSLLVAALDNASLSIATSGNASWFGQAATVYAGGSALQSGAVSHGQNTVLEAALPALEAPSTVSFFWKVSSEFEYDLLTCFLDGVEVGTVSGEAGWRQETIEVPAGNHTLRWEYAKDGSVSSGSDAGWVDQLVIVPKLALTVTTTGAGSGTASAEPGALAWNATTGTAYYTSGTAVTLTATSAAGASFTGWGGDADSCGTALTCTLTMSAAKNITATFSAPGNAIASPLPDTGQGKCYNESTEIPCPSPGQPFYGQDAQYQGRPRSYTKLGANDMELPDTATQAQGWLATRDNVTGLIWELKTVDGSIHDQGNTYTWCDPNPATNGGDQGTCGNGTDTAGFIAAVNSTNFAGHGDWRLPTVKELSTLVNSAIPYPGPTIDQAWFPNTVSSVYWSSTIIAGYTSVVWCVDFAQGDDEGDYKDAIHSVRAVRGGQTPPAHLVDNGDGTVSDPATCLMWQQATAPGMYTWPQALAYAENLVFPVGTYDDWRLPNRNELRTLVDYTKLAPAIDTAFFPDTVSSLYWSSTTVASNTGIAWLVSFDYGYVSYDGKLNSNSYYVRAVRGGQCGALVPLVISRTGSGTGRVTSAPAGIDCGTDSCRAEFSHNTAVTLTASPDQGATFAGWGGDAASCGTAATCTLTMSAAKNITATFSAPDNATASPLPDTGQGKCYNESTEIPCPSPGQPFYGQDAQYHGRPRSYTKLGANDVVLPDSATQAQGWLATRDNVTGLIWEMKTADGSIHSMDDMYTWCDLNPATNGGNQGTCGNGTDSADFIVALNNANFAGRADWRLPTIEELFSLVNSGIAAPGPTIDQAWFPNTLPTRYWSSTTNVNDPSLAWRVGYYRGDADYDNKGSQYPVRAVRGTMPRASFVINQGNLQGTVTETKNCLMWQQATALGTYSWQQALAYVAGLNNGKLAGFDDWRLPSRNELQTLVEYSRGNQAINTAYFPDTVSAIYWSATTAAYAAGDAWYVYFGDGGSDGSGKNDSNYVRAVRNTQCGASETVPSAPSNVSATAGNGQATINFTAPASNGGSPVSSYTVTSSPGGLTASGASSPLTISGLSNGVSYTFTVTASNAIGTGPASTPSNSVTPTSALLPDTGQNKCYDASTEIPCPSPGQPFYGQDAQYQGRQRSYTKLGANDVVLPDSATQAQGWLATRDNVTGLIWEMKTDDNSIHDKDNTYTWCDPSPASNGGNQGTCGNDIDTTDFIAVVNSANFAGHGDWRLPTVKELSFLVNSAVPYPGPTIDQAWFPNTVSSVYWSSTAHASSALFASDVYFSAGHVLHNRKYDSYYVRAVRGGQTSAATLVDNGDGTVSDPATCLMWQQASAPGMYTWQQAIAYAENLIFPAGAYDDWRLPNRNELQTLVDHSQTFPTIDRTFFSDTVSSMYWSSTSETAGSANYAWHVDFYYGSVSNNNKGNGYYVRVVRNTQCGASETVPSEPSNVSATAGNGQATINFTAPASTGGSPVSSYTVTSSPGGLTASGASSPLTISGLSNGTSYTFTVTASNAIGTGPASTPSNSVTPTSALLPDTGQNKCYDASTEIPCPAPGQPFYGQDAQYQGRQRSYTKLGANDVVLPDSATQAQGWLATRDNVTGLIWEMKTDDNSIHDKDNTYTWCDPSPVSNGGNQGTCGNGTDNADFIAAVNSANFAGHGDWRLPTVMELSSLVNSAIPNPGTTIDQAWFPNTLSSLAWSSTIIAGYTSAAWCVDFAQGYDEGDFKDADHSVRAVRGGQLRTTTFVNNGDGTVSDPKTCLMWQQASAPATYTWQQALAYAENLIFPAGAYDDWRLPNRNELQTLVDHSQTSPTIDRTFFPDTASSWYRSSTTKANQPYVAWDVSFSEGNVGSNGKHDSYYVRAVRWGQCGGATATAPGPPTSIAATAGNGQASITFTAPASNGGSPVSSYTATSSPGGLTASGAASPLTVNGLSNGTAYTFIVTASNAVGTGAASEVSNSVIPFTVPGPPTNISATAGNGQATVNFSAPAATGGRPVASYTVTADPGGKTASSEASPITVKGLTNGIAYTFTVTATNAAGTGPASAVSNSVTPASVPGSPVIGNATAGNGQASIAFAAPASNGGSQVSGYTASSNPGGLSASGPGSPLTVTGLTNGATYTFTVTALNAIGTGAPSTPSNAVTPATVPGPPTNVFATADNGQASIRFAAPAETGGSPLAGYQATSNPGGISASSDSSPITITGLANGTPYTFTVTATNAVGAGAASAPSNRVTPTTVPGVPANLSARPGNRQATVSFTAPAVSGGSPITVYSVTASPGGLIATGATSPITVTGLTNGVSYTFTVTASNVVGTGASSPASGSVTPADASAPVVSEFFIPPAAISISIPVLGLSATGPAAIRHWCITESDQSVGCAWSDRRPLDYSFTGIPRGATTLKSLYAWVKDAAGRVSEPYIASTSVTLLLAGDVNGDGMVDMADAILILAAVSGMPPAQPLLIEADTDGDHALTVSDALFVVWQVAAGR